MYALADGSGWYSANMGSYAGDSCTSDGLATCEAGAVTTGPAKLSAQRRNTPFSRPWEIIWPPNGVDP